MAAWASSPRAPAGGTPSTRRPLAPTACPARAEPNRTQTLSKQTLQSADKPPKNSRGGMRTLKKLTTWASRSGRWRRRKAARASIHSRVRSAVSHEYAPPPLAGVAAIARGGDRRWEKAEPTSKVRSGQASESGYFPEQSCWAVLGLWKTWEESPVRLLSSLFVCFSFLKLTIEIVPNSQACYGIWP